MPGLTPERLKEAGRYRAALRSRAEREAAQEAWEERAAIMEEGAKVDRATAERWATACIQRVRGAV